MAAPKFNMPVFWHEPVKDMKEFKDKTEEMEECSARFVESISDVVYKDADGTFWLQQDVIVLEKALLPLALDNAEVIEKNLILMNRTNQKKD